MIDRRGQVLPSSLVVADAWNARRIPHARGEHELPLVRWGFSGWRTPAAVGDVKGLSIRVRIDERCHVGGLPALNSEGLYNVRDST